MTNLRSALNQGQDRTTSFPIKNSKTDVASPIKELVIKKPVKVATQEADGVRRIHYDEP